VRVIEKVMGKVSPVSVTLLEIKGIYIVRRINSQTGSAVQTRHESPDTALAEYNDYAMAYAGAAPVLSIET
jgi:hypothetical protein